MQDVHPKAAAPDLAADLASMRALAEEGRDAPLVGGDFYMLWGSIIGAASLAMFFAETGAISFGRNGMFILWIAAGLIGWAATFLVGRRMGARPGSLTVGNRTARAVWFAVGAFMTLIWIAMMVIHDNFTALGVPRYFLFSMMFPIAFGLYGVAFYATAVASRQTWLNGFALLSWAFSVLCLFLLDSPYQFLASAAGSFSCAALPGLMMKLRESKAA
ncbi:MAG: hypothetical protein R3C58_02535 [Parvularculaceae bacterium]